MTNSDFWDIFFGTIFVCAVHERGKQAGIKDMTLEMESKAQRESIDELRRTINEMLKRQK